MEKQLPNGKGGDTIGSASKHLDTTPTKWNNNFFRSSHTNGN